jgi:hypothetical protein
MGKQFVHLQLKLDLYSLVHGTTFAIFSSPCQRQCELLPSLGIRRLSFLHQVSDAGSGEPLV